MKTIWRPELGQDLLTEERLAGPTQYAETLHWLFSSRKTFPCSRPFVTELSAPGLALRPHNFQDRSMPLGPIYSFPLGEEVKLEVPPLRNV